MMLDFRALFVARKRPPEETLVQLAIRLGEYEGKPVSATDIADLVKIPRTSVLRHLSALQAQGQIRAEKVGRRVMLRPLKDDFPRNREFYRDVERIVRLVCRELSKMDT